MNGEAKLAKLGANLIIEKKWEEKGGKGKRRKYKIKRRDRQTSCRLRERGEGDRGDRGREIQVFI